MKWGNILVKVILCSFITLGLYGAASVSYTTITGTAPCPSVGFVPACFVVFIGYLLMLIASIAILQQRQLNRLFFIGWTPVFLLAFIGSLFELSNGATCPKSNSGLPLCYVSLSFALVVIGLYTLLIKMRNIKNA